VPDGMHGINLRNAITRGVRQHVQGDFREHRGGRDSAQQRETSADCLRS
jgi:hypothetical protein